MGKNNLRLSLRETQLPSRDIGGVIRHQHADPPHPVGLLRMRHERPRCRRAAESQDELAARFHSITSSARSSRVGGIVRPMAPAVFRFTARHRVDHGTICGRGCANSGHYKPLCACVDRTFVNPNSFRAEHTLTNFFLDAGAASNYRTDSGRYDQRRDSEWPQVAREIIIAEKPKFVVMMIGNNDRQTIREKAPPPAPANAQPIQPPPAVPPSRPDLERQPVEQQHPHLTPAQARQADYGPWEFQSEKWELAYIKRIDATIAALKSAGVPVIWVGLSSQRGTNATDESSYLNELYRSEAEKAGIVYVDIWDGFVDEGRKVLATRTGLSRTDAPITDERWRLFYEVRRS
jgi:hypothetical protein